MLRINKDIPAGRVVKHSASNNKNSGKFARDINSGAGAPSSVSRRPVSSSKSSSVTRIQNDLNRSADSREGAKSAASLNFSDLDSTRIDFEEANAVVQGQVIESDNNSDIVIDEKKIVPESSKFKIVFISSESKSGSELNSSLEYPDQASPDSAGGDDELKNVKGDFIDEVSRDVLCGNVRSNE